jgi:prephenate dehydrogenase
MRIRRIAIVGLGQIGGSLILALRKRKLSYHLTGIDPSRKRLRLLASHLDASVASTQQFPDADLVILCLHYKETIDYLLRAPRGKLILDVCSAKQKIVKRATGLGLRFIGGHPMAGNERAAEAGWDPDLFTGHPFFLCPTSRLQKTDLQSIRKLVSAIGADPTVVDPAAHDRHLATTSHFPAFLSRAFAELTTSTPEMYRGPGYHSMTRLAHTSPELLQTFLLANGDNVLLSAEKLQRALNRWIKKAGVQVKKTKRKQG